VTFFWLARSSSCFSKRSQYYLPTTEKAARSISIFLNGGHSAKTFCHAGAENLHDFAKVWNGDCSLRNSTWAHCAAHKKEARESEMDRLIVLLKIFTYFHTQKRFPPGFSRFTVTLMSRWKKTCRCLSLYYEWISPENSAQRSGFIANMTTNSFCRYFKKRLENRTSTSLLNQDRQARNLSRKDLSISQICYEVGFNNLSNFNRKFRELCSTTPTNLKNIKPLVAKTPARFIIPREFDILE